MKEIYFDHSATTAVKREVLNEMIPYFNLEYGNPSSLYYIGREAKRAIECARRKVARAINCCEEEVYFTSCGSESDNLAIKGFAYANRCRGNHIITSKIEHPAVLNTCKNLEHKGFRVTYINVDENGFVDINQLKRNICNDTILISIMMANNELGTIQNIKEIGKIAHRNNIVFHTDAVQAVGNIKIDVQSMNVDMLSMSAHKFYGPKGVGALYVRKGINFERIQDGGHQEKNKRSGTENVAGIIGLATAADIAVNTLHYRMEKEWNIQRYMAERIVNEIPYTSINGNMTGRVSGNINICFKGISAGELVLLLDKQGICVSSGSACHGNHGGPSHVLKAIGKTDEESLASIRLTFNHTLNQNQADYCIDCIKKNVAALRKIKND